MVGIRNNIYKGFEKLFKKNENYWIRIAAVGLRIDPSVSNVGKVGKIESSFSFAILDRYFVDSFIPLVLVNIAHKSIDIFRGRGSGPHSERFTNRIRPRRVRDR